VVAIDQPIALPATPPKLEHRLDLERGTHLAKPFDGNALELAAFEQRHDLLVDARRASDVDLAQAEVHPHRRDQSTGLLICH
jgi:hypothetical protein